MARSPLFERPNDRARELRGTAGQVRFLELPPRRFVMIDGDGPAGPAAFGPRLPGLYATAYSLRSAMKTRGVLTKVGPLEGLWWTADGATDLDVILAGERGSWRWTLLVALPDDAMDAEIDAALAAGMAKVEPEHRLSLRVATFDEGRVAQVLHVGPYAAERASIERLHAAVAEAGLTHGRHHEIYVGDPNRSAPERLKTLLRHPVA